jgi:prepilin-type N-terminal cleavage/methylation domain-containing protein
MRIAPRKLSTQAGLTLIEVMIASAIMVVMLTLAWSTISNMSEAKNRGEQFELRNHEIRLAMNRVVMDLEAAYLSKNEESAASYPRTQFVGKSGSAIPEIRFSTMGHRVLWADANESEQTLISYEALASKTNPSETNWVRREQRRLAHRNMTEEPAEYDVLLRDIYKVTFEFWDWKNESWKDRWDTTAADGERGRLPSRVRITLMNKNGDEYKLITQARILMQEPLNFVQ